MLQANKKQETIFPNEAITKGRTGPSKLIKAH